MGGLDQRAGETIWSGDVVGEVGCGFGWGGLQYGVVDLGGCRLVKWQWSLDSPPRCVGVCDRAGTAGSG